MQPFDSYRLINHSISSFNRAIGRALAWLTVVMVLVTTAIVIVRAGWNIGSIGSQELTTYCHATVIMFASAYTLAEDEHVRVDIFYRRFSTLQKAWADLVGSLLLLLPFALATLFIGWNFVANSWAIHESSSDVGGLPYVYLLKSLLLVNGVLLALQALADSAGKLVVIAEETHRG